MELWYTETPIWWNKGNELKPLKSDVDGLKWKKATNINPNWVDEFTCSLIIPRDKKFSLIKIVSFGITKYYFLLEIKAQNANSRATFGLDIYTTYIMGRQLATYSTSTNEIDKLSSWVSPNIKGIIRKEPLPLKYELEDEETGISDLWDINNPTQRRELSSYEATTYFVISSGSKIKAYPIIHSALNNTRISCNIDYWDNGVKKTERCDNALWTFSTFLEGFLKSQEGTILGVFTGVSLFRLRDIKWSLKVDVDADQNSVYECNFIYIEFTSNVQHKLKPLKTYNSTNVISENYLGLENLFTIHKTEHYLSFVNGFVLNASDGFVHHIDLPIPIAYDDYQVQMLGMRNSKNAAMESMKATKDVNIMSSFGNAAMGAISMIGGAMMLNPSMVAAGGAGLISGITSGMKAGTQYDNQKRELEAKYADMRASTQGEFTTTDLKGVDYLAKTFINEFYKDGKKYDVGYTMFDYNDYLFKFFQMETSPQLINEVIGSNSRYLKVPEETLSELIQKNYQDLTPYEIKGVQALLKNGIRIAGKNEFN